MPETVITVEGSHTARVPAELASVSLSARADGPDREPVVAAVTAAAAALRASIEPLVAPDAVTTWSADRVRVWSQRPWSQDGAQLEPVHYASVDTSATFSDFEALASWIERAVGMEHVAVDNVSWSLRDETIAEVISQARALAVEDAVATASAYARSLGLGPVTPTAIADPGLLGESGQPQGSAEARLAMKADAVGGAEPLALKPESIEVYAAVHARFTAS